MPHRLRWGIFFIGYVIILATGKMQEWNLISFQATRQGPDNTRKIIMVFVGHFILLIHYRKLI